MMGNPLPMSYTNGTLTLNLTAKTYRYLDEGEAGAPAAADDSKGKKGSKTRREREQEKKT